MLAIPPGLMRWIFGFALASPSWRWLQKRPGLEGPGLDQSRG